MIKLFQKKKSAEEERKEAQKVAAISILDEISKLIDAEVKKIEKEKARIPPGVSERKVSIDDLDECINRCIDIEREIEEARSYLKEKAPSEETARVYVRSARDHVAEAISGIESLKKTNGTGVVTGVSLWHEKLKQALGITNTRLT